MHSVSVKMDEKEFGLLDGMAKASHKSRAEIMREALRVKLAFDERARLAVLDGLESAKNDPLLSDEDANAHFEAFKRSIHG